MRNRIAAWLRSLADRVDGYEHALNQAEQYGNYEGLPFNKATYGEEK